MKGVFIHTQLWDGICRSMSQNAVIQVNDREDARLITAGFQDSTSHVHGSMTPTDADELQPRENVCPPWRSRGQISNGTLTIPGLCCGSCGAAYRGRTCPPYA